MKTLGSLLTALFLIINVQAQELPRKQRFCFNVGINIGFFYPNDINDYIAEKLPAHETAFGVDGIFGNFNLSTGLGFKIYKNFEFQWLVEGTMAPKYIMATSGEEYYFNFWKVSSGLMANYHIPFNETGKHSFYIGTGPLFHYMTFESYNAYTVGGRFQVGLSLNNYKVNPQIFIAGDYAYAEDQGFGLNYSCVKIGGSVNF